MGFYKAKKKNWAKPFILYSFKLYKNLQKSCKMLVILIKIRFYSFYDVEDLPKKGGMMWKIYLDDVEDLPFMWNLIFTNST